MNSFLVQRSEMHRGELSGGRYTAVDMLDVSDQVREPLPNDNFPWTNLDPLSTFRGPVRVGNLSPKLHQQVVESLI